MIIIKKGQHYKADKSQITVEVIAEKKERRPNGKTTYTLRPHVKKYVDFDIWEETLVDEIGKGRWVLTYDPDAPEPEFDGSRNRLEDIE